MGLGISPEHVALADSVARWAQKAGVVASARALADGSPPVRPAWWSDLAGLGMFDMLSDGSCADVAVVVDVLGAAAAPGGYLPTALAVLLLRRHRAADAAARVADAALPVALSLGEDALHATEDAGALVVSGELRTVLGSADAEALLAPVHLPDGRRWVLLGTEGCAVESRRGLDPTRPLLAVRADGVRTGAATQLPTLTDPEVGALLATLLAVESAGVARWCLRTAVEHAKVREQFGRPIGAFQAVKHRCADMLAEVELASAAAWDAANAWDEGDPGAEAQLAVATAAAVSLDAAVECAKSCIQVLGGIGFTWEHDAHLFFKRAAANRQLAGGSALWRDRAARLALGGVRRTPRVPVPEDAEPLRAQVRDFLAGLSGRDPARLRRAVADAGYLVPHWPQPYGRAASAVEQLVVDEEFRAAGVARPDLVIGNWALPAILQYGSDEQRARFVRPTLYGDITWCQMFSEPGAGSDLASLQTKASRAPGGWRLTGQKVWTSSARTADWAICLARLEGTHGHEGITYFLVDMTSEGIDVRPLRELTGDALFNEVFLSAVFVPDDCVVGEPGDGWRVTRTTLANERVAMSAGTAFPSGIEELLSAVPGGGQADPAVLDRVGALVCRAQAEALLGVRSLAARVSGTDPGAASSVRKLVGMHLRQDAAELALVLGGLDAAVDAPATVHRFLGTRALTIAGGTSEVQRNVIGERLLGLPRG